jgi:hypothetical protein
VTEKGDKETGRGAGGASTPLLPENGEAREARRTERTEQ